MQGLINAGIEAAKGYFRENETTVIILDENGQPSKRQKTVQKTWYPPNAALNKFYVANYGKQEGFTNDPLEYELRKTKQEFDQLQDKQKNWDIDF